MNEIKNVYIEPSAKTPLVDFNYLTGDLILSGRSIPENPTEIYDPLCKWLNEYIAQPRKNTNFRINLEYFNTASSIWLARMIKTLSKIEDPEDLLMIHLYFNIEEFESMLTEDIKESLSPIVDIVNNTVISIGVKIYGTDENGAVMKETIVLL
jgi:hypothetical protein